jgi:hypothetical protein
LISAYDLLELLDELGNISGYSNFAESASFNLSIFYAASIYFYVSISAFDLLFFFGLTSESSVASSTFYYDSNGLSYYSVV